MPEFHSYVCMHVCMICMCYALFCNPQYIYIYIYIYTHTRTHTYLTYIHTSVFTVLTKIKTMHRMQEGRRNWKSQTWRPPRSSVYPGGKCCSQARRRGVRYGSRQHQSACHAFGKFWLCTCTDWEWNVCGELLSRGGVCGVGGRRCWCVWVRWSTRERIV